MEWVAAENIKIAWNGEWVDWLPMKATSKCVCGGGEWEEPSSTNHRLHSIKATIY